MYSKGFADPRKERINKSGGNDREETTQISENPAKEKSKLILNSRKESLFLYAIFNKA